MSEPIPETLTLSDEQLEELARKIARYLPSYLVYRDPPTIPVGTVEPPEGDDTSPETGVIQLEATAQRNPPDVPTFG